MTIANISDIPTYNHVLPAAPSELITGPIEPVWALAGQVVANDEKTLASLEIEDRTAREGIILNRLNVALLRINIEALQATANELRAIQTGVSRKLTIGLIEEIAVEAAASPDPAATAARLAEERFAALPYDTVDAWIKTEWATYATTSPELVLGRARASLDSVAQKSNRLVSQDTAAAIVAARVTYDRLNPIAPQIAAALARLIDANRASTTTDIWTVRQVTLAGELRQLLLDTADKQGRVKLLNTKAAFAKAGIRLESGEP